MPPVALADDKKNVPSVIMCKLIELFLCFHLHGDTYSFFTLQEYAGCVLAFLTAYMKGNVPEIIRISFH